MYFLNVQSLLRQILEKLRVALQMVSREVCLVPLQSMRSDYIGFTYNLKAKTKTPALSQMTQHHQVASFWFDEFS